MTVFEFKVQNSKLLLCTGDGKLRFRELGIPYINSKFKINKQILGSDNF
jgi:hypothetical protein